MNEALMSSLQRWAASFVWLPPACWLTVITKEELREVTKRDACVGKNAIPSLACHIRSAESSVVKRLLTVTGGTNGGGGQLGAANKERRNFQESLEEQ